MTLLLPKADDANIDDELPNIPDDDGGRGVYVFVLLDIKPPRVVDTAFILEELLLLPPPPSLCRFLNGVVNNPVLDANVAVKFLTA